MEASDLALNQETIEALRKLEQKEHFEVLTYIQSMPAGQARVIVNNFRKVLSGEFLDKACDLLRENWDK